MLVAAPDTDNIVRVRNTFIDISDEPSDNEDFPRPRRVTMPNLLSESMEELGPLPGSLLAAATEPASRAQPLLLGTAPGAAVPGAAAKAVALPALPPREAPPPLKVVVKNTFLEEGGEPESPRPCRHVTCPGLLQPGLVAGESDSEEDLPQLPPAAACRSIVRQDRRVSFPDPQDIKECFPLEEMLDAGSEVESPSESPQQSPRVCRGNAFDTQDLREHLEATQAQQLPTMLPPSFIMQEPGLTQSPDACIPNRSASLEDEQACSAPPAANAAPRVLSIASAMGEQCETGPQPWPAAYGLAPMPWLPPWAPCAEQWAWMPCAPAAEQKPPPPQAPARSNRRLRLWAHIYLHMQLPGFDLVPRLIGRGGANMKRIAEATGAKLRIRGKGSGHLEVEGREAPTPLMVAVTTDREDCRSFRHAVELLLQELRRSEASFRTFCEKKGTPHAGPGFSIGIWSKEAENCLAEVCSDVPLSLRAGRAEE